MNSKISAVVTAGAALGSLALAPLAAGAAQAAPTAAPTYQVTTDSSGAKMMTFTGATVTGTDGAPKVTTSDGSTGYLPKKISANGKTYTVAYQVVNDHSVRATASPAAANGQVQAAGYWKCVAKGTLGGATAGAVTGLLGGPFAEVTVPGGAASGAVTGGVSSLVTCA